MTSSEISQYEKKVDQFILDHSPANVSNGIRNFLKSLYANPSGQFNFEKLLIKENETVRLKPAAFKKLVREEILHRLEDKSVNDRAIIIYKYLVGAYTGNPQCDEPLDTHLQLIVQKHIFPKNKDTVHREGGLGKYKAVGNLFTKPESIPSAHTLMFCIAILDFPLDQILKFKNFSDITSPETLIPIHQNDSFSKRKRYLWISIVGILIIIAALFGYTRLVNPQTTSRTIIESKNLFSGPPIKDLLVNKDSLYIRIISLQPTGDKVIIEQDHIPVNFAILRFQIVNATDKHYFTDHLYIKTNKLPYQVNSESIIPGTSTSAVSIPAISFNPESELSIFTILNEENAGHIEPYSSVLGSIKIDRKSSNYQGMLELELGFLMHSDENKDYYIAAPKNKFYAN